MLGSFRNLFQRPKKRQEEERFSVQFRPESFIPGLIIGFLFGWFLDLAKPIKNNSTGNKSLLDKQQHQRLASNSGDEEFKMVLVVRQDLKMKSGKIASQCAYAATGMYAQLIQSQRSLLRQWEQCGQPKIVLSCKNEQEMNKLKASAEKIGLPTFVVADAGRTQVLSGSRTVVAIGPGGKAMVDSVTRHLYPCFDGLSMSSDANSNR